MARQDNNVAVRFENPEYVNWVKAVHCLRHFRDGIKGTVTKVGRAFYNEQLSTLEAKPCGHAKWTCSCAGCQGFVNKIKAYHRSKTQIDRENLNKNTNCNKWTSQEEGPWEVSKVFMGRGLQKKKSVDDTDASNLVTFFEHCKYLDEVFKNTPKELKKNLRETKEFRNELMHSGSLKLKNEDLTKKTKLLQSILGNFYVTDDETQQAMREIDQLCSEDLTKLTQENPEKAKELENDAISEKIEELNRRVENLEANAQDPKMVGELKRVIDFVNENQDLRNQFEQKLDDFSKKIYQKLQDDMRELGENNSNAVEELKNQLTDLQCQMDRLSLTTTDLSGSDCSGTHHKNELQQFVQKGGWNSLPSYTKEICNAKWKVTVKIGDWTYSTPAQYENFRHGEQDTAKGALSELKKKSTEELQTIMKPACETANVIVIQDNEDIDEPKDCKSELKKLLDKLKSGNAEYNETSSGGQFKAKVSFEIPYVIAVSSNSIKNGKQDAAKELWTKYLRADGDSEEGITSFLEHMHSQCGKRKISSPAYYQVKNDATTFTILAAHTKCSSKVKLEVCGKERLSKADSHQRAAAVALSVVTKLKIAEFHIEKLEDMEGAKKSEQSNTTTSQSSTSSSQSSTSTKSNTSINPVNKSKAPISQVDRPITPQCPQNVGTGSGERAGASLPADKGNGKRPDYVSQLNIFCQKEKLSVPVYTYELKDKKFIAELKNNDWKYLYKLPPGQCCSKKVDAEKKLALMIMKAQFPDITDCTEQIAKNQLQTEVERKYKQKFTYTTNQDPVDNKLFVSEMQLPVQINSSECYSSKADAKSDVACKALKAFMQLN